MPSLSPKTVAHVSSARPVVLIDGLDGSGKSTWAKQLAQACEAHGSVPLVLHVDDVRRPQQWDPQSEAEQYYHRYYEFEALQTCVAAYQLGATSCSLRVFNGQDETLGEQRQIALARVDLLIVEGVFVQRIGVAQGGCCIYLETSYEEARRRIMQRDQQRGRSSVEIARRIEQRYFPAQRRYHATFAPRERAAVVIEVSQPAQPRLLRLSKKQLEGLPSTIISELYARCGSVIDRLDEG